MPQFVPSVRESFRPAQTLCCDGPDSKVIEDLCVIFTASPKARPRSAIGFERGMTTQATCRCSHRSFPTRRPRSFATEQLANASSSWRAGGCLVRLSMAASRLRTSATRSSARRRWLGRRNRCVVPATRFANTPIRSRVKRRHGSRRARIGPLFAFAGLRTPWRGVQTQRALRSKRSQPNPDQAMPNLCSQMSFGALGGTQITRHFDREIERGASFLRQMVQGGGAELLTP